MSNQKYLPCLGVNILGQLLKQVLNFIWDLSAVSNTFEQDINLVYDLVFVLITGSQNQYPIPD